MQRMRGTCACRHCQVPRTPADQMERRLAACANPRIRRTLARTAIVWDGTLTVLYAVSGVVGLIIKLGRM